MRYFIVFVFLLISSLHAFCQNIPNEMRRALISGSSTQNNLGYDILLNQSDDYSNTEKKGEWFYFNDWKSGHFYGVNNQDYLLDSINLYLNTQSIIFVENTEAYYLTIDKVRKVIVDDNVFAPYYFANTTSGNQLFLAQELVISDAISLLKSVTVHEEVEEVKGNMGVKTNQFKKSYKLKENYVYVLGSNKLVKEIPRNKKKFLAIFPDNPQKVKDYMADNKLSHKNEEHLIEIFEFYSRK